MVGMGALWMPVVVAAVLVFAASFAVWMVLPHHRSDWSWLPDEEAVRRALTKDIPPGQYVVPFAADAKALEDESYRLKCEEGPLGILTMRRPAKPSLGKPLLLSFLYYMLVAAAVAYVTGSSLPEGARYLDVFRVSGAAATLAFAGALPMEALWFGRPWGVTLKAMADGVAYGLLTAGVFGWLWPR